MSGLPVPRLVWSRLFPGEAWQVAGAREFVGAALEGHPGEQDARLVVSELACNAITHTRSGWSDGWFVVHVMLFDRWVRLRTFDLGHPSNTPAPAVRAPDDEKGRGLLLVAALTKQWGVEGDDTGFVVWADIACGGEP